MFKYCLGRIYSYSNTNKLLTPLRKEPLVLESYVQVKILDVESEVIGTSLN